MPIHDFHCRACGASFELLVQASTPLLCAHCGAAEIEKQLSAPAAPSRSSRLIAGARRQAASEGHFSNYSAAERPRSK